VNWKVAVGCAELGEDEKEQVLSVLDSGWLSPGPKVKAFESRFAQLHDSKHGVMVNSGTDALRIALLTLKEVHGWSEGSEVIVPAMTFVASVNVILQAGLKPVFVDVSPRDYCIDPEKIEAAITYKTVAVMGVNLFGNMADYYLFARALQDRGIKLIEDSCETMGIRYVGASEGNVGVGRDKKVGTFGDISCFSTYSCHLIVTGVGGIAITNNSQYAEIMRSYANHGRDPYFLGDYSRMSGDLDPEEMIQKRFLYHRVGYSSRVSEFEAAVGLAQLKKLPSIIQRRQANAERITMELYPLFWNGVDGSLKLPETPVINRTRAWMMYPLVLKDPSLNRDSVCLELEKRGIETRPLMPLLTQPVYKDLFGNIAKNYPVAYESTTRGFYVGCHQLLTHDDISHLGESLREVCGTPRRVHVTA